MLQIFWILLLLLNLFLGYKKQNVTIIQVITLMVIMVLMCGNSEGPDITGLIHVYSHPEEIELNDIGYEFLEKVFREYLHLDFIYFRYIITSVFMLMLWNTLNYFKVNIHFFVALYMCYLFFIDTIQHRNFYAMVTISFTIRYIIDYNKKNIFKFIILTTLLSTVHIITLTNFLYLIVTHMKRKIAVFVFAVLGSAIAILSLVVKIMGGNMMLLISSILLPKEFRANGYLETETRFSGIALSILVIWALILCYKVKKRVCKVEINERKRRLVDAVLLYSLVTLIFLGTLLLNVSFYRFFRNILILQFMAMIIWLNTYKISSQKRFLYFISVFGLSFMWFVVDICLIEGIDVCVDPIFEHNFLWE